MLHRLINTLSFLQRQQEVSDMVDICALVTRTSKKNVCKEQPVTSSEADTVGIVYPWLQPLLILYFVGG